jgi:hypothetical protein
VQNWKVCQRFSFSHNLSVHLSDPLMLSRSEARLSNRASCTERLVPSGVEVGRSKSKHVDVYFQYTELAEVSIPKSTPPTELAEVPTPNSLHRACRGAISPFFSKKSQPFLPNNPLNITIFHSFQPGKNPHSSRGIPPYFPKDKILYKIPDPL